MYDSPVMQDCSHALAALPQADPFYSYYFEQQFETAPPESDWQGWTDDRPSSLQRKVVQLPKFWSYGSCNLALLSYVDGNFKTALSLSRWPDVYLAGYALVQACLNLHSQGGAATVIDAYSQPALTIFLWKNGAIFDKMMNEYTSAAFPAGIDPRLPAILKAFGSFNSSVDTFNGTLPEDIDFNHPMSLTNPNLLNSVLNPSHNTTVDTLLPDSSQDHLENEGRDGGNDEVPRLESLERKSKSRSISENAISPQAT